MPPSLDQQLKNSVPSCASPDGLHDSIMSAVRSTSVTPASPKLNLSLRLALTGACALLLASLGVFLAARQTSPSPPAADTKPAIIAAEKALSVGDRLSRAAPAALTAPVERELELISRDLESTGQFLLSSLP